MSLGQGKLVVHRGILRWMMGRWSCR